MKLNSKTKQSEKHPFILFGFQNKISPTKKNCSMPWKTNKREKARIICIIFRTREKKAHTSIDQ
jgi:hypothetical protein